jgi:hypothetical protein
MKTALYILGGVVLLLLVAFGGLLVRPGRFPAPTDMPGATGGERSRMSPRLVPIPDGLPAPVDRWLRADYPDGAPAYDTAYMRGRGVMRIGPLELPFRHRVEYRPGEGFVRQMDLTWYGIAVLHGLDTFVGGRGRMVTPGGAFDGPQIDQGANIANWLEATASPGTLLSDPRVRWEPIDDNSARLVVPLGDEEDSMVIGFDPVTGEPTTARAKRFRGASDGEKSEWLVEMRDRKRVNGGVRVSSTIDATWVGDARPWATFRYDSGWGNVAVPELDDAERAAEQGTEAAAAGS